MKNSAAYVGRVGGLAVALGIGTAVFTGNGVAMADSSEGGSGPASNDSSETKPGPSNAGTTQSDGGVQSSTTNPSDDEPATADEDTDSPTAKPARKRTRHSTVTPGSEAQDEKKSAANVVARPSLNNTERTGIRPPADGASSRAAETQAAESNSVRDTAEPASAATKVAMPATRAVSGRQAAQVTTTESAIAPTALTSVALDAPPANPVAPAAPRPSLFGFVQLAWRELSRGFFGGGSSANQRPTIVYNAADSRVVDGTLVGRVTATDPDSTLKLTATKPAHGALMVNPDGTFTYTPDASYSGRDSFRITATEVGGASTGGLAGLIRAATFGLFGGGGNRSASTTIAVGGGYTSSTVVSGLKSPTDFRFLPDGRILFAEKGGAIKATTNDGQLQSTPLITLPSNTVWARGVNGIEVDPDYEENGYIYVSYIRSDNYQRLSRLTVTDPSADVLTVDPASEVVLVQGTDPSGNDHHGGGLSFGPDGKLYWSLGDNVCCSVTDGRNSQDLSNIYGKVLRLNPDGSAPTDNPFYDGAGPNYDGIYATGFRNPFRLAFTPDGKLLVADVGQAKWEEVNLITAGANYGWPNAEGPCDGIGTTNCETPSSYTNPIYAYRHTSGGNSITAVMGYSGLSANGQKTVLIADYNQGWVKKVTFNADYSEVLDVSTFDAAASGATSKLAQGPDGSIYQLTYAGKLTLLAPPVGAPV